MCPMKFQRSLKNRKSGEFMDRENGHATRDTDTFLKRAPEQLKGEGNEISERQNK